VLEHNAKARLRPPRPTSGRGCITLYLDPHAHPFTPL
jgi:hypothetical protein